MNTLAHNNNMRVSAQKTAEVAKSEDNVHSLGSVVRLKPSYVHYAKPVVTRKLPIELVQSVAALLDAFVIFCAGLVLLPAEGVSGIVAAFGLSALFVFVRTCIGGYARSVVRKTA